MSTESNDTTNDTPNDPDTVNVPVVKLSRDALVFAQMYWCVHEFFQNKTIEKSAGHSNSYEVEVARIALGWDRGRTERAHTAQGAPTLIYTGQPAEWTVQAGRDWLVAHGAGDWVDPWSLAQSIARAIRDLESPVTRNGIYWRVLEAIQNAEELGGPVGHEYIALMTDIVDEATGRMRTEQLMLRPAESDDDAPGGADVDPALLPGVEELACEFSRMLRLVLTEEQMGQVVARNAAEQEPDVCHSHDFCDATQVMLSSFRNKTGFEGSPLVDRIGDLMEAAHTMARERGFATEPVTAELKLLDSGVYAFAFRGTNISNPCASEPSGQSRLVVSPRYYGFEIWETGGGCTAWGRKFANGLEMLVTSIDDASHKIDASGACTVGVYHERDGEILVADFEGTDSEPATSFFQHLRAARRESGS